MAYCYICTYSLDRYIYSVYKQIIIKSIYFIVLLVYLYCICLINRLFILYTIYNYIRIQRVNFNQFFLTLCGCGITFIYIYIIYLCLFRYFINFLFIISIS